MRLAQISLFLLLAIAIHSAGALAQPTICVLSVKESQSWWTSPQLPMADALPNRALRFDLKKLVSFVANLQGEDGYFRYSPGSDRRGPIETLLALEIFSEIGADPQSTINVDMLRENLGWRWGYTISGAWQPSAGVQAMIILSYSLLGVAPPTTERNYFVNLAKESQNPDGGIGWYRGGPSALWSTYFTVKGLKMLNSLNVINIQAMLSYIKQNLANYKSLAVEDLYYALATLDLLDRKDELNPQLGDEIYNWLKQFYYFDYRQMYYVLASMKILKGKIECDEAEIVELLREYYDPDTGGFQWWSLTNSSLVPNIEHTWAALKLLKLLPSVRIVNYKVMFYVDVQTPFSFVIGKGWYEDGSSATLSLEQTIIYESSSIRYVFEGWYERGVLLSQAPIVKIDVTKPVQLVIAWRKQYYVKVLSNVGNVEGEGWYSEGDFAEVRLTETEVGGPLVRYVFDGWEELKPEDRILGPGVVSVYVDGPRVLRAVWRADYSRAYALAFILIAGVVAVGFLAFSRRRGTTVAATAAATQPPSGEAAQPQPPVERAATVAVAPFDALKAELEKYEEFLKKLEDLKAGGRVSEQAYQALKSEYEAKIQELKKKLGLAGSS